LTFDKRILVRVVPDPTLEVVLHGLIEFRIEADIAACSVAGGGCSAAGRDREPGVV